MWYDTKAAESVLDPRQLLPGGKPESANYFRGQGGDDRRSLNSGFAD